MLDILRMAKNEELAVKMIFSAEQPLTGMNEGPWFHRRMCRKLKVLQFPDFYFPSWINLGVLCKAVQSEDIVETYTFEFVGDAK